MSARYAPAILVGRAVRAAARLRARGGGSAIPGLVVNRIAPGFLSAALRTFPAGLIVVSGSSGKSTTTKMLVAVLEAHGLRVFTNPSTANISQGLTSALLERADLVGRIDAEIAVLEMDEGHGARMASDLDPRVVLLTNVMTDQIDRFVDSERVRGLLSRIAARATEALVVNADDAFLQEIATEASVEVDRFGVADAVWSSLPRGLGYARTTTERIAPSAGTVVLASAGDEAEFDITGERRRIRMPARGVHYAVDAAAAIQAAIRVLGDRLDVDVTAAALDAMPPVFGRGEVARVRDQEVEFVLVQNPASFQLNIDALETEPEQVLFAMGSDVRDPAYFWPVDPARLGRVRIVSGSKAHEAALHLMYRGVAIDRVEPDLATALDQFLELPTPETGRKTVVFTADAMRRTRSHLGLTA